MLVGQKTLGQDKMAVRSTNLGAFFAQRVFATATVVYFVSPRVDAERNEAAAHPKAAGNAAHAAKPLRLGLLLIDFSESAVITHWAKHLMSRTLMFETFEFT